VVFDKTGTLTTGRAGVAAHWFLHSPTCPHPPDRLKALAAGIARHSTHPFSQAVANLSEEPVEVQEWRELRGAGLVATARLDGHDCTVRFGSLRWLLKEPLQEESGPRFVKEWSERGASVIALSLDKQVVALFALQDQLKPGALDVVQSLVDVGIEVYLATGDNQPTATSLASQAGISLDHVLAEVRPEQKAEFISSLQQRGERVAFVGDGINDAPALEQAHLGVAVGRASDVAREAAAVVLLNSDIAAVPESLDLARATLRTIKQNLFWAFFYNAAAIPLAALGFLSPILCAVAMGASDLVVIGNALRLRRRVPQG
jgi:Cu+-exporting ATPase